MINFLEEELKRHNEGSEEDVNEEGEARKEEEEKGSEKRSEKMEMEIRKLKATVWELIKRRDRRRDQEGGKIRNKE